MEESFCVGLNIEDIELSSEEGEETETEPNRGEETDTDPFLDFSLEGFSASGFCLEGEKLGFSVSGLCLEGENLELSEGGFCLEGEKLGLWWFVEESVEKERVLELLGGKDLRLRKRVSR